MIIISSKPFLKKKVLRVSISFWTQLFWVVICFENNYFGSQYPSEAQYCNLIYFNMRLRRWSQCIFFWITIWRFPKNKKIRSIRPFRHKIIIRIGVDLKSCFQKTALTFAAQALFHMHCDVVPGVISRLLKDRNIVLTDAWVNFFETWTFLETVGH